MVINFFLSHPIVDICIYVLSRCCAGLATLSFSGVGPVRLFLAPVCGRRRRAYMKFTSRFHAFHFIQQSTASKSSRKILTAIVLQTHHVHFVRHSPETHICSIRLSSSDYLHLTFFNSTSDYLRHCLLSSIFRHSSDSHSYTKHQSDPSSQPQTLKLSQSHQTLRQDQHLLLWSQARPPSNQRCVATIIQTPMHTHIHLIARHRQREEARNIPHPLKCEEPYSKLSVLRVGVTEYRRLTTISSVHESRRQCSQ